MITGIAKHTKINHFFHLILFVLLIHNLQSMCSAFDFLVISNIYAINCLL